MHIEELLHKTFSKKLPQVHKTRLASLMTVCKAGLVSKQLYLTELGRSLSNRYKECSNIQKVDRLLGNGHLQAERKFFYQVMMNIVLQDMAYAWIHIDWTCINSTTKRYVLRASVSMHGRCLVIYEECFSKTQENNHATHIAFLNQLNNLLPSSVKPIIVTDAGFRAPWFAYIIALGWDFVGRLRHKNAICLEDNSQWQLSDTLFGQATSKPSYIGQGLLTQEGKVPAHFVVYKARPKGTTVLTQRKKKSASSRSKRYAKANKEPWVLATSLSHAKINPLLVVNIYRQRMRIEENIRDTKCAHFGLGLKNSLTKCSQRMNILLLIAAICTLAAWLAGLHIKSIGKASDFQAHSAKFSSLSYVFLGRRAIRKKLILTQNQFMNALLLLYQCAIQAQQEFHHYD